MPLGQPWQSGWRRHSSAVGAFDPPARPASNAPAAVCSRCCLHDSRLCNSAVRAILCNYMDASRERSPCGMGRRTAGGAIKTSGKGASNAPGAVEWQCVEAIQGTQNPLFERSYGYAAFILLYSKEYSHGPGFKPVCAMPGSPSPSRWSGRFPAAPAPRLDWDRRYRCIPSPHWS
jgi:hypothetical protein